MKLRLVCLPLLLASAFVMRAQLILNPGDVWTYSFDTLPFTGTTLPSGAGTSYGYIAMGFSFFGSGATLQYEMFEGVPAGGNASRSGLVTSGSAFSATQPFLWQDLNGSLRFRMLTGACTVGGVTFGVGKPNPQNPLNQVDTYSAAASLTSPPPRLVIAPSSNMIEVSWWTNGAAGYVLESTNVLSSGAWPPSPYLPFVASNRYAVVVEPVGQAYFRLRK